MDDHLLQTDQTQTDTNENPGVLQHEFFIDGHKISILKSNNKLAISILREGEETPSFDQFNDLELVESFMAIFRKTYLHANKEDYIGLLRDVKFPLEVNTWRMGFHDALMKYYVFPDEIIRLGNLRIQSYCRDVYVYMFLPVLSKLLKLKPKGLDSVMFLNLMASHIVRNDFLDEEDELRTDVHGIINLDKVIEETNTHDTEG